MDDDGILRIVVNDGIEDVSTASANVEATRALVGSTRVPVLVDLRYVRGISREAREVYSGERVACFTDAAALLTSSAISRVIGNFFIGFNRASFPRLLFVDETRALAWLRGFVK